MTGKGLIVKKKYGRSRRAGAKRRGSIRFDVPKKSPRKIFRIRNGVGISRILRGKIAKRPVPAPSEPVTDPDVQIVRESETTVEKTILDYRNMAYKQLQSIAAVRGLKYVGVKKTDLIEQLQSTYS
jgi:beta-lactam-binding protein with PASTA domain